MQCLTFDDAVVREHPAYGPLNPLVPRSDHFALVGPYGVFPTTTTVVVFGFAVLLAVLAFLRGCGCCCAVGFACRRRPPPLLLLLLLRRRLGATTTTTTTTPLFLLAIVHGRSTGRPLVLPTSHERHLPAPTPPQPTGNFSQQRLAGRLRCGAVRLARRLQPFRTTALCGAC